MPCGERAALLEQLQSRYKESPTAIALTSQGQLLEVLVSPEGGWTILVTAPKGPTCLLAVGESWQTRPQLALDPGA